MAEWWQSPAYLQRQAAGQVVTPGLIDIGGLVNAFNAPYNERVGRLPDGPAGTGTGRIIATPQPAYTAVQSPKTDRYSPGMDDPMNLYMRSNYVAQPRFASIPKADATQQDPLQQYAESGYVAKPRFIAANGMKTQPQRLASGPAGWDPSYGYMPQPSAPPALKAIEAAAPKGPMFPLQMPGKGAPFNGNYTASMRFASPNAGKSGDGIIDLTASNPSDRGAQGIADSQGAPVRVGGKVYYPGGKAPVNAAPQARNVAPTQQRASGMGGLFGSIFGGGNPVNITVPGGGSSLIGNSPSQGQAMVVAPGTASGSVLSGMGFSDGALVPAATIRGLESRGYFK